MVLLSDLYNQFLSRCDMENSQFVDGTAGLDLLRSSLAELHELLISHFGDEYAVAETYLTLTSGDSLPLPSDFFKLLTLDFQRGDGYVPVDRWVQNERARYSRPRPVPTGVYRLAYIPRFDSSLTLTSQLPDYMAMQNWYEYAVVDCCIKAMVKEESNEIPFVQQKLALIQRIQTYASNRDAGQTVFLADVSGWNDDYEWFDLDRRCSNVLYRLYGNQIKLVRSSGYDG